MRTVARRNEEGFTLIELLTVIGILGILAWLSINSYHTYISSAGYAVAKESLKQAQTALEASFVVPDAVYPNVNFSQNSQGPLTDASAAAVYPEFQVPRKVGVTLFHDGSCVVASCLAEQIEVRHCRGDKYLYWSRWGDGTEALVEDIPGNGC